MTREEAIKGLKVLRKDFSGYKPNEEMFDMAIKALEQEPCEDAISRQAVKEQMIKYGFHAPDMTVTEFVEDLPSVKPQPKTGHWIILPPIFEEICKCSNCHKKFKEALQFGCKPCPNCGAKMVEPQEK